VSADRPDPPKRPGPRPTHPKVPGLILIVGVLVVLFALAALSTFRF
jgi:hypothetical protein